ncbi:nuclear transport factor 2 family protein [Flagellimonas lutimaris]|uniref:Nuclear transport factor 2 family protein n=1 Tax=Flagellimonas lutimaris TaxID=475082 RepID=A0A3A1NDZ8_9FLAO|nr:nuclear transport factor 2 family protein [Allomuricauda lutimaris]RIV36666.1 nuclear transport factor 2 family protein [Allomuricauda lutimaris]
MYDKLSNEIKTVVSHYFQGIYNGDIDKLKNVFHLQTLLFGDIKGEPYFKTVTDYIEGVKSRKSPADLGEEFKMEIPSIEIMGDMATVKAHVPMLGFNYHDFLSLSLVPGEWKIVNKLFTHV